MTPFHYIKTKNEQALFLIIRVQRIKDAHDKHNILWGTINVLVCILISYLLNGGVLTYLYRQPKWNKCPQYNFSILFLLSVVVS